MIVSLLMVWQPTSFAMAESEDYNTHCYESYKLLESKIINDYDSNYTKKKTSGNNIEL